MRASHLVQLAENGARHEQEIRQTVHRHLGDVWEAFGEAREAIEHEDQEAGVGGEVAACFDGGCSLQQAVNEGFRVCRRQRGLDSKQAEYYV